MKVAVIGGAGRMGRWFVKYFLDRGYEVIVSDIRHDEARIFAESVRAEFVEDNVEAAKSAEIIVLSTPIEATPNILEEIALKLDPSVTVLEICSIKCHVIPVLRRIAGQGILTLSLHPLFGPGVEKIRDEKVALVPICNVVSELKIAKNLFPEMEIIVVDAEEHDKAMALTLSLPHFLNMVFASTIMDEDINALKKLGGTTFRLQLVISEGVMSEDPSLYASIQMSNPYTIQFLEKFKSRADMLKGYVTKKDLEGFIKICADIRESLSKDKDFPNAYKRMYEVLKAL